MILLVPKIALVCLALFQFHGAKKRGWLAAYHYWYAGLCGYNLAASFTSGLLWNGVETLYYICIAGFTVSLLLDVAKLFRGTKAIKKNQAELEAIKKIIEIFAEDKDTKELQQPMEDVL